MTRTLLALGVAFACGTLWTPAAAAAAYAIDADHTTIQFTIRHLLTNVRGTFNEFEGTLVYEPGQPDQWKADVTMQAASIDTRVAQRDDHLRSADFLDAARYPTITFTGTNVTDVTEDGCTLTGELTIHGVAKPVSLAVEILGVATDPWGNVRASFSASTTINRKDFGLTWNKAVETGQLLVGEELDITLDVEAIRQP